MMVLAAGLQVFRTDGLALMTLLPQALILIYAVIFLAIGAAAIAEALSGTVVRERGIEMFGTVHPWSRIVVERWLERDGGFVLRLLIVPPQLLDMPCGGGCEIDVLVPASQRPALEAFLAEHYT